MEKQLELGERHKLMEITHKDKRYVIAGGPWRQQRDQDRRQRQIGKGEAQLKRLAAVKRKKVDPQKLASQVGRSLQRLKAHKYFSYHVEPAGQLRWERKEELIARESQQDGWYLLHTNEPIDRCTGQQVLAHYKRITGCGGSLLRTQELPGSPSRASSPARPGDQPRAVDHPVGPDRKS